MNQFFQTQIKIPFIWCVVKYPKGECPQSGKGYQLWPDHCEAVTVVTLDGYKKGGCPLIISTVQ